MWTRRAAGGAERLKRIAGVDDELQSAARPPALSCDGIGVLERCEVRAPRRELVGFRGASHGKIQSMKSEVGAAHSPPCNNRDGEFPEDAGMVDG